MTTINTLSQRTNFKYSGTCDSGFYLEYSGRPFVSHELMQKVLQHFKGQTIPGGFNVTNPSGFGAWIQSNSSLSSRHASHIAAVLVHEKKITHSFEGNSIILHFP